MNRIEDDEPELAHVARLLDSAAEQEARDMRAAEHLDRAPGLDRVAPTLARAWGARAPTARPRLLVLGSIAAAAALVLFVVLRGGNEPAEPGPRGEYLGDARVVLVHPPERAARWDRLEWTGPRDATYRVRVRAADSGAVLFGPRVHSDGTVLELQAADTANWPRKILVELEMRRADGTWSSAESRSCELQP